MALLPHYTLDSEGIRVLNVSGTESVELFKRQKNRGEERLENNGRGRIQNLMRVYPRETKDPLAIHTLKDPDTAYV